MSEKKEKMGDKDAVAKLRQLIKEEAFYPIYYYSILLMVLFSLLGYFVYGGTNGALAILLLSIACYFMAFISVIPFVGCLIQAFLMKMFIPKIATITGIYLTWLTSTIFLVYLLAGIVVTTVFSILALDAIEKHL